MARRALGEPSKPTEPGEDPNAEYDFDLDEGKSFSSKRGSGGIAGGAIQWARVMNGEFPPESVDDPNSSNFSRHWTCKDGELYSVLDAKTAEARRKSEESWESFFEKFGEQLHGFDHAWWLYAAVSNIGREVKKSPELAEYVRQQMFDDTLSDNVHSSAEVSANPERS